mgnify:CR=1 FL=1
MAKECYVCGKKQVAGNQVSHSHIANGRTFGANLQKKSIEVDGKINKDRYARYVDLYGKLKENWEKKYD